MNISESPDLFEICLAGLLHDIGKFSQRAHKNKDDLDKKSKNMIDYICPSKDCGHSHIHSIWTYDFFEKPYFNVPSGVNKTEIQKIASYHHKPGDDFNYEVIKIADHCSSGSDRMGASDEDPANYYETPLLSIFSEVRINKDSSKKYHTLLPLEPESLEKLELLFPGEKKHSKLSRQKYQEHWTRFKKEVSKIYTGNRKLFLGALMSLLKKYCWCIPSSTYKTEPDISLYDHMITTSAIASSIYAYHQQMDQIGDMKSLRDDKTKKFRMIIGDISGIQKFIFDMRQQGSKGISKIMRGRSFYVSQLTNAASHIILDELGLPVTCKIIDAGGRFMIIAPNTDETIVKLKQCQKNIEEYCLTSFMGQLSLNLNFEVQFSQGDLKRRDKCKDLIQKVVAYHVEKTKKKPLLTSLKNLGFLFEKGYFALQKNGPCKICGKEAALKEGGYRGAICDFAIEEIGRKLPKAKYIVLKNVNKEIKGTSKNSLPGSMNYVVAVE